MGYPIFLRLPLILYASANLSFLLLIVFDRNRLLPGVTSAIVAINFLLEILCEAGIIYATGNVNSPFAALFILTIVSAALYYRLVGTLVMASIVSLAHAFIIWLGLAYASDRLSANALQTIFHSEDGVFYSILLHILIFYLVAFIAGYLGDRLRDKDMKLADTSLALRRAKLETDDILKHLNSGLISIDPLGHIVFFNRSAEMILGYREEEIRGIHCEAVFAERMPELSRCLMNSIRLKQAHVRSEIEIVNSEGKRIPLGLSISILTQPDHSIRGVIVIFSDLTEAKYLEAKIRTADRLAAIGELSASIAHEIRNPLTAISGSVEVLRAGLPVDGEDQRLMELIIKESKRLNKILSDFLTYAKIDRPAYTKVDLCHVIGEVIQLLYHYNVCTESVDIDFQSDKSVVYMVGDEDLLKQLLINLAVNACESLEGGRGFLRFRVETSEHPGKVVLFVQDNGSGIDKETLRQMYKPFYSTKKKGTGLGLAIVHRICSALEFSIKVDSEKGVGTTFRLEFSEFGIAQPDQAAPEDLMTSV